MRNVWDNHLSPNRFEPSESLWADSYQQEMGRLQGAGITGDVATQRAMAFADQSVQSAQPSMLQKYGPLAAVGLGATYLAGGFKPRIEGEQLHDMSAEQDARAADMRRINAGTPLQFSGEYNPSHYFTGLPPSLRGDPTGRGLMAWELDRLA